MKKGFTLVEILVAVLIIGVLAAIALPMYQKAVLKSRFAALMPIAKSISDSNEAYYLEHGQYAASPQDLPVQGQEDYPDGTSVDLVSDENYTYTISYNEDKLPDHNYIVFQKHSTQFAGATMCEARDEVAGEVCLAMGGTPVEGGGGVTGGWTAYLLSGTQYEGDNLASGNETGADTSTALDAETLAKLQAVATIQCPEEQTQYVCTIKNGTVSQCDTTRATMTAEGECVKDIHGDGIYETIYNPDGTKKEAYACSVNGKSFCHVGKIFTYDNDVIASGKIRSCANQKTITKDLHCPNDQYSTSETYNNNSDETYDSNGNWLTYNICSSVDSEGNCTAYGGMHRYDRPSPSNPSYFIHYACTSISTTNPTTCESWKKQ